MVSPRKACLGKPMSERPGLMDPNRERMVGLKPVTADQELTAGAHLFNPGDPAERIYDQGYVTSVGHSPTLGHMIGLGFLKNGTERWGEKVTLVDHMRGVTTECEVVNPVFFDPEGGRLRD